ncbi:MAG TPA: PRC-barrel domain-containing protein [Azospirillum sp.]|nr:PRC-barrel domain-containing protein [Azospirillum sp.]
MRQFPCSNGLLGATLILGALAATSAAAQQPCPDLERLDQRIAALESSGAINPPPTPAEIGGLRALRQSAVRLSQAGQVDACAVLVRTGLAAARNIEAPQAVDADDLHKIKLRGAGGEDVGSIDDVMIDPTTGRIAYGIVELGGFLGLGQRQFPVPWAAFQPIAGGQELVLNVPKDRLVGAPQFSGSNRPNMADRQWALAVHTYYGVPPYWLQDIAALPLANAATGTDAVSRLNQQVQQLSQEVTRLNQELAQARAAPAATAPATGSTSGDTPGTPPGGTGASGTPQKQ